MNLEPLPHPTICFCCERRPAIVQSDVGMPLCAPCWGIAWAKEELSQPPTPGNERLRDFFRTLEEELTKQLMEQP